MTDPLAVSEHPRMSGLFRFPLDPVLLTLRASEDAVLLGMDLSRLEEQVEGRAIPLATP